MLLATLRLLWRMIRQLPSSSLLEQIMAAYARPNRVKIKDKSAVLKKLLAIASQGPSALQVITDFDDTITQPFLNENKCDNSFEIFIKSPLVSSKCKEEIVELYKEYLPIETSTTMTSQDKIPFVMEFYRKVAQIIATTKPVLKREIVSKIAALSKTPLRENATLTVKRLDEAGVPLLIVSAGLGDIIEAIMETSGIMLPNVKVVSNFMQFDAAGEIMRFKTPFVHIFNKEEASIYNATSEYFKDLNSRHNVILLGDLLDDGNMNHGATKCENVLKIGFLNTHLEEQLEEFMAAFDIVLVDDNSFDFVNLLLDHVLNPSN